MEVNDLLAAPSASSVHSTLAPMIVEPGLSLLGSNDAPPAEPGGNDPGLNSATVFSDSSTPNTGGSMKTHHWIMIAVVIAVLLGLWYYFGSSAGAA